MKWHLCGVLKDKLKSVKDYTEGDFPGGVGSEGEILEGREKIMPSGN